MTVSGIDWSAAHNKIVSCSHDRNAYVWNFIPATADEPSYWKPGLVILRFDRAAIDVKWALDGMRFAATSGSKCVAVCTYEADHDWWVSKMIKKKIKSTVVCCAFHPTNGQLLATGSSDFKCRVFSTFSTEVDGTRVDAGPFGVPQEFGEPYVELSAMGWVNAVAWSPSGSTLAFAGQDCSIHFATFQGGNPVVQTIRFKELPLYKLLFVSDYAIIGAGHDYQPTAYNLSGMRVIHAVND
jgi:actin related protein 2/3 complex subunit 1A/1B